MNLFQGFKVDNFVSFGVQSVLRF
uniref:Uncharacterized protein n=1 Tax=Rhizophora mucronata TaxID=61149 RepID=A0A2P2PJK1_RHIMU